MQKIALINDPFVSAICTRTEPVYVQLYNSEDSIKSCESSSAYSNDEDNLSLMDLNSQSTTQQMEDKKEVKKRQRLTHLSAEEKILRRKLKNRMAAQSARDRKKLRMEELEQELVELKAQNEKLKSENQLLKENAKQLIEENRKLLKFKADFSQQQQVVIPKEEVKQINTPKQQQQILSESSLIGPNLKPAETTASTNVSKVYLRSNLVHSELDHQRNKHSKSEKNQSKISTPTTANNQLRLLPARAKTTASNHDENNKVKSNLAESAQAVKILPATRRYSVNGENNCINKMQSSAQIVSKSVASRNEKQSERLQTNDICFINDELNEKQTALDVSTPTTSSFYFDEDLLDELLKTNIKESDNNKYPTSISDKIDYSILKLENSFKSDSLLNLQKEYEHDGLDLTGELDYDSINQIMNEFFSKSFDMSTNECELDYLNSNININNTSSNNTTNFMLNQKTNLVDFDLNSDVLVQKFDPMIGNSLFDIKLI